MGKKTIDVFCGIGGLTLGFAKGGGCETAVAMEAEKYAARTFALNHPKTAVMFGDCRKFQPASMKEIVGKIEGVVGGVPCEPFSRARRLDFSRTDPRRNLINYALKLVAAFQPAFFCFENVWGAPTSPSWKKARARISKAGYSVNVWRLDASDHGSPQARKRAFLVGVRGYAGEVEPPASLPGKKKTVTDAWKGLGEPKEGGDPMHPPMKEMPANVKNAIKMGKPGDGLANHVPGAGHYTAWLAADKPSRTVLTGRHLVHPSGKRWITAREAARIQEIPDDYKFATGEPGAWKLLGDCVPVSLGAAVCKKLLSYVTKAVGGDVDAAELEAAFEELEKGLWTCDDTAKADAAMQGQARRAARTDKLTVGEFFFQPKPTRPAAPEQLQTVKGLVDLYEERGEKWLPTFAQKKYDGANHQIHKDGDDVRIYSEDGDDNTDRLPGIVAAVKALKPDKLVMPAEIEAWDGSQHLPREAAAGYLSSKDEPDDSHLVANVYDVLWDGDGDIHGKPTFERLEALAALKLPQSTMGAPDLKHRLNAAPSVKVDDLEELERAVEKIRKLAGSEGAVMKQADSPYPLEQTTPDTWVKFHNATTIRAVVTGREKTKGGVWVYQYAVLPGKEEPAETAEVGGRKVVPVGDTFATSLDLSEGDGILVEAETVNLERTPDGVRLTAWVPRAIAESTEKPDTVDAAAARAKKNLVLQEKDVDDKGKVTYRPTRKAAKQQDPYLEVPPEDRKYKFSVQHHWRGKSLHADVRVEMERKGLLIGWTMNTQIAGAVKEPVTTMAEARRWSTKEGLNKVSKVNWITGEWATRPKAGTDKLVRTEILCERKAPEPHAWLNVEGKTKDPEPGKPPPVGGTRQFPGVFDIVDQGTVEYGAQKPWFHEYFWRGGGLNYRMFFRQLRLRKAEEPGPCEACSSDADALVAWGDAEPALLCKGCVDEVLERADVVLPPSEEQPMPEGAAWLAIYPDDQQPYVLDDDAVKKKWMPPDGRSALPKAVRDQVPAEHRYWAKKGDAARSARDALVAALKAKEVELDYEAPYKTRKATMLDADWVLQEQTWRGPIQVRVGPTRTRWWLRLDVGRPELVVLELERNPVDNKKVAARVSRDKHKDSMDLTGAIKPGHYLNPTKETPSNIEKLDGGKAEVLSLSGDLVKVKLSGKKLKGVYAATRNNDEWLWAPSEEAPRTKIRETEKRIEFELHIPFDRVWVEKGKDGKEKRLVTGIALEPDEVDAQNDWERAEVIERAAHQFLRDYNKPPEEGGTQLGYMHKEFGDIGIELVESSIAHADYHLGGKSDAKKVKKGSWVVTVHVSSDKRWKEVKEGKLTGFSVGGIATVAGN